MSNSEPHFCSLCKKKMRYNDLMEDYTCQNFSCSAFIRPNPVGKRLFIRPQLEIEEIKKLKSDKTKLQINKTTKSDDKK